MTYQRFYLLPFSIKVWGRVLCDIALSLLFGSLTNKQKSFHKVSLSINITSSVGIKALREVW